MKKDYLIYFKDETNQCRYIETFHGNEKDAQRRREQLDKTREDVHNTTYFYKILDPKRTELKEDPKILWDSASCYMKTRKEKQ